jgi:hypothetical protein
MPGSGPNLPPLEGEKGGIRFCRMRAHDPDASVMSNKRAGRAVIPACGVVPDQSSSLRDTFSFVR